ncbi:MAG: Lysine-tRNA ligase [Parcubacteria group bacterium GW2011_GWD2_42_14]|nr:MAG: Lysine-tRNA ligase [Parcubacteria group bacterium GW2011_GWD2_42_14]
MKKALSSEDRTLLTEAYKDFFTTSNSGFILEVAKIQGIKKADDIHNKIRLLTKDDDYVEAMEYGMPPISGWGMGLERIVALLTQQKNLRDVVMFPLLRPKD